MRAIRNRNGKMLTLFEKARKDSGIWARRCAVNGQFYTVGVDLIEGNYFGWYHREGQQKRYIGVVARWITTQNLLRLADIEYL